MTPAQDALFKLCERLFREGEVTAEERARLRSLCRQGALTLRDARDVFNEFLKKTWNEIANEREVSEDERAKLSSISEELRRPFVT